MKFNKTRVQFLEKYLKFNLNFMFRFNVLIFLQFDALSLEDKCDGVVHSIDDVLCRVLRVVFSLEQASTDENTEPMLSGRVRALNVALRVVSNHVDCFEGSFIL